MPRLVLHAGDCKSGSTAIQSVLQLGSWRFTGDTPPRVLYAKGGRRDGLNHHRLSDSLHLEQAREYRDLAWGRLAEEFAAAREDVVVISSERFEFAPPEAVHAALLQFLPDAMDDLQVVIYVRPHVPRLLSGYAQNVRQGLFTGELDGFLDWPGVDGRFHYAERLAAWKAVFGKALVARPMIRAQLVGECVVHDFLSICAGEGGSVPLVEKIPNENRSLNPVGLALIRTLQMSLKERNPARDPGRAQLLQQLCTRLEALPAFGEGKIELPSALRVRLGQTFAEDAARCDAEIFGAPVLVPALENALTEVTSQTSPIPVPEEVTRLRDLSLTWIDMMGQMRQQMSKSIQARRGASTPNRPRGQ